MSYHYISSLVSRILRTRYLEISLIVILLLIAMLVALWLGWLINDVPDYGDSLKINAAITAGVLATIGWLIQSAISVTNHRAQHTVTTLQQMRNDSEFNRHRDTIFRRFPPRTTMSEQEAAELFDIWRRPDAHANDPDIEHKRELISSIRYLLNYYDFIALCIRLGHIDMELFADSQRTVLGHFHRKTQYFIDCARNDSGFGGALSWRHFVWLVDNPKFNKSNLRN
ncbi:DUF4760 domain-containing protein [Pacificispira sp.]|uniref:DUF4760 domain-containing protein n=1 Tax=Pacificispira sp. TaxID=2888761 RepID=UPI003BABBCDA